MRILSLDEYIKANEDFHNPFDNKEKENKPVRIADAGGSFVQRKETFNLSRVEWSKRPGGDYTVIAKTQFARGEVIEICPLIILSDIAKTIDRLKDLIFEIDPKKGEYGLVLGYGSMYRHSDKPNVDYAYNKRQKHMFFIANRTINMNEELSIDYGKDYWEERSNLNLMAKEGGDYTGKAQPEGGEGEVEESGLQLQTNAADIQQRQSRVLFAHPKGKGNPAVTGVALKGLGQQ